MDFKVGDKVLIKPESNFYTNTKANPKDTIGEIVGYDSSNFFPWKVLWPTFPDYNVYDAEDLELATPSINEQKLKKALGLSQNQNSSEDT